MCNKFESILCVNSEECRIWKFQIFFYAEENNTLLDRSKLGCTRNDMMKLRESVNKTDVIELCSRKKMNRKWRFHKLKNLTVFAALLKNVPMVCMDAVRAKPLLSNLAISFFTFEENTRQPLFDDLCHFRALAPRLSGNQKLQQKDIKSFQLVINRIVGLSPN